MFVDIYICIYPTTVEHQIPQRKKKFNCLKSKKEGKLSFNIKKEIKEFCIKVGMTGQARM